MKFEELANYLIKKKIVENFHIPYACSEETLKRAMEEDKERASIYFKPKLGYI